MSTVITAVLSTKNLIHNINIIKRIANKSKIIAVVKANGYGHDIKSVSTRIQNHVDMLGVASIEEAIILKKINIIKPILLMYGVFEKKDLSIALNKGFHVVFHNKEQIEWLNELKTNKKIGKNTQERGRKIKEIKKINAGIKINTGMCRLGFDIDEFMKYFDILYNSEKVNKPIHVMSHFACADDKSHPLNKEQITKFKALIKEISLKYDKIKQKQNPNITYSFCNSAAIFNFPECHYDYVRPGIAIYGASPFDIDNQLVDSKSIDNQLINNPLIKELGLKPVMTLKSKVIAIRNIQKNDTVGYGANFKAKYDMRIALIFYGYGNGYPREVEYGGKVLINGKAYFIIGRISMNMIAIDIGMNKDIINKIENDKRNKDKKKNIDFFDNQKNNDQENYTEVKIGDDVILWGEDLPVEELAKFTNTINYNILLNVPSRIKFIWEDEL